jgi:hypothetical protein
MPVKQRHSMIGNPNRQNLIEVATCERTINASLERVWENVKDWAYLPHLHADNFNYSELDEADTWGWRIWKHMAIFLMSPHGLRISTASHLLALNNLGR